MLNALDNQTVTFTAEQNKGGTYIGCSPTGFPLLI